MHYRINENAKILLDTVITELYKMLDKGKTFEQIAIDTGIPKSTLVQFKNRRSRDIHLIFILAEYLNITPTINKKALVLNGHIVCPQCKRIIGKSKFCQNCKSQLI